MAAPAWHAAETSPEGLRGPHALRDPRVLIVIGAMFTFLALVNAAETYAANNTYGKGLSWAYALLWGALTWYLWLAAIPLLLVVSRLMGRVPGGWPARLLVSGMVNLVISAAHALLVVSVYLTLLGHLKEVGMFVRYRYFVLMTDLLVGSVLCAAVLFAAEALSYYERFQQGQLRATQLESQLAQAQLQALKMQLQPHFLFNTLHSISALQMVDVAAAQDMTARLGDFLRITLRSTNCQEVTLGQELEFLNCYLDIERIRFGNRLTVDIRAEPDTLDAQVPNLMLQPIVENAIRHGINAHIGPGRLTISADRIDAGLRVRVTDNGPGIPDLGHIQVPEGVGLRNTRARLEQLYRGKQHLELRNVDGGGLEVNITIPFQRAHRPEEGVHA